MNVEAQKTRMAAPVSFSRWLAIPFIDNISRKKSVSLGRLPLEMNYVLVTRPVSRVQANKKGDLCLDGFYVASLSRHPEISSNVRESLRAVFAVCAAG
jgi:hypothetical protein